MINSFYSDVDDDVNVDNNKQEVEEQIDNVKSFSNQSKYLRSLMMHVFVSLLSLFVMLKHVKKCLIINVACMHMRYVCKS